MTTVGTVKEIWRYPVKSMGGDTIRSASIGARGIVGDRAWAMHDDAEILSARHYPKFLMCHARYVDEPAEDRSTPVQIDFPDGSKLKSGEAGVDEKISGVVGTPVKLMHLQPESDLQYYRRRQRNEKEFMDYIWKQFGREPGEPLPDMEKFPPELMEFAAFPGMHFDVTPLQLLTTASLRHMAECNPGANWSVRRFRPNILIETAQGLGGLVEAGWAGKTVRVGALKMLVPAPTPRCAMTMQAQRDLPFDKSILRSIVKEADQNLGAYATALGSGTVSVGDAVVLE